MILFEMIFSMTSDYTVIDCLIILALSEDCVLIHGWFCFRLRSWGRRVAWRRLKEWWSWWSSWKRRGNCSAPPPRWVGELRANQSSVTVRALGTKMISLIALKFIMSLWMPSVLIFKPQKCSSTSKMIAQLSFGRNAQRIRALNWCLLCL